MYSLFDTHNHFDDPKFDHDRIEQAHLAYQQGVEQMVITGITADTFGQIVTVQNQLNTLSDIQTHIALGLHPFFIHQHTESDLQILEQYIQQHNVIAIGEIGLDTFTKDMKQPDTIAKQQEFFIAQLDLAVQYQLPVLLHIRKAHGESLKILKNHAHKKNAYNAHQLGGIAHSFSGGEQEAKAFVKLGFKLGITGQVCNPNAKKLRTSITSAVAEFGLDCLVIETDCPDMLPLSYKKPCHSQENSESKNQSSKSMRNTPANLMYIVNTLSELLHIDKVVLAKQLWENSLKGLNYRA